MLHFLLVFLCALLPMSGADSLHVAFHDRSETANAMSPSAAPLTPGSRVKPNVETWNNITAAQPGLSWTFTNLALNKADGSSSEAKISGDVGYVGNNSGSMNLSKDTVMMRGWFGIRETEKITISDLPESIRGHYHVIIYGDCDTSSRTMHYTVGSTTKTIEDSGTFSGAFVDGQHFVMFTNLSGPILTILGNAAGVSYRSAINGISVIAGEPRLPMAIASFTASKAYTAPNSQVSLSWSVEHADQVAISPEIGPVAASGSVTVTVSATTEFTLTATQGNSQQTQKLRVGVGPPRPNVLLVLVDDYGIMDTSVPFVYTQFAAGGTPVVHPLNQRYQTPNMERLAASGMKFTQAYAANVCTPSRTSLMSGLNPTRHHVTTWTHRETPRDTGDAPNAHPLSPPANWQKGGIDPTKLTLLPRLLQSAGYRTMLFGKAHFGPASEPISDPRTIGFDINIGGKSIGQPGSYYGSNNFGTGFDHVEDLEEFHGQDIFLTEALSRKLSAEITKAVADGVPFFAYDSHYAVHAPFQIDSRFAANYPQLSGDQKAFATLVEGSDKSLGDHLDQLEELGVAEDTLVIFMGDNGTDAPIPFDAGQIGPANPFRGKKTHAYEGGLRVPLLISWAKHNPNNPFQQQLLIPEGGVSHDMAMIWDLMPTILSAAGVAVPQGLDGVNLAPYLKAEPGTHRPQEFVINFPHSHQYEDFYVMMRLDQWKLIYRYLTQSYELYDLVADLGEQTNLASQAAHHEKLMQLSRHMIRRLNEMDYQPPRDRLAPGNPETPVLIPNLPEVDSDGDGIPDIQEDANRNGMVDPGETDPELADTDGDGTNDGDERKVGTDPLDPSSAFRAIIRETAAAYVIEWPSLPGASFTIRQSSDLVDWSKIIHLNYPAAAAPARITDLTILKPTAQNEFFKVSVN